MENNEKPVKENKKISASFTWGMILIAAGIIWLLCALDCINLSFSNIIRYIIPFGLIICGATLLIKNKTAKIITIAVCFLVFLLLVIFTGGKDRHHERHCGNHHFRAEHRGLVYHGGMRAEFDVEIRENGVVELEVAAGAAALNATGKITGNNLDIYKNDELKESISADVKEKKIFVKGNEDKGSFNLEMALNNTSIYELSLELGAVASNLDISAYKVQKLDIETGASSVEVTLGDKMDKVNVEIEAGAGDITLRIPKNSGCKVVSEGFLVEKELPEFTKVDGAFQTENFATSTKTVFVKFEGAVSNLEVVRY
ncbi:MAG: hypothetical protein LBR45_03205 [Bacteroidales bacterium]|jgi:hypothetical protein|nr:hypothetical protein [Bacteroidales bacterium]